MIVLIAAAALLATIVLGVASLVIGRGKAHGPEHRGALYLRSSSAGFFILLVCAISATVFS